MNRPAAFFLWLLLPVAATPLALSAPDPPATLRWHNGETLAGEIVAASGDGVTWKSPLFEDPLLLRWEVLDRMDHALKPVAPADPFAFTLRDGSHLYGGLTGLTEDTVDIHSTRHGDVALARSEVLNMRRIKGGGLLFAGPSGDVGWKEVSLTNFRVNFINGSSVSTAPFIPFLLTGAGGALVLPYWNRGAFLALATPDRVEFEFQLRSSKRPEFQFTFDGDPKEGLRVATWGDELVLSANNAFKSIRNLGDNEREIALRICWDRQTRHCAVFTLGGEPLAEWQVPGKAVAAPAKSPETGLTLQNKGRDLTLDLLRVRAWDRQPPPKVDVRQPRVELAGGGVAAGKVARGSARDVELSGAPDLIEMVTGVPPLAAAVPLDRVDEIVFSADPLNPGQAQPVLSYADATMLLGSIVAFKDGKATLQTSFTRAPLASRLDGICRIANIAPGPSPKAALAEPPLAGLDKIVIGKTTLHGQMVSTGDDQLSWLPVGGVKPARPVANLPLEMTRAIPADAQFPSTPALFYTRSDDVLPGSLRAIDQSGAEFDSSVVETTKLPPGALAAVQFLGADPHVHLQSFSDPGWRVLKGDATTVQRAGNTLKMEPDTSLGHPTAMQCHELQFSLDAATSGWSVARLRMFCAGTNPARATNLVLVEMSGRLTFGLETQDGQLENQSQVRLSGDVAVRLAIEDKQVELYLDGVLAQTYPIAAKDRPGSGLIIEPGSMWGNQVTPITLSGFSTLTVPGQVRVASVNPEAKTEALTVPRFRQDDPPKNALLAANGDVLRGEIEAATGNAFAFRSGLENLRVPRERVEAAIWLQKPDASQPPPAEQSPGSKLLEQRISQRARYASGTLSSFINFLERQVPGLKIQPPARTDDRQFPLQFGGETVASALHKICALYGLSYRTDSAGAVILEPGDQPTKDLVRKVYWVRPEAFPATGSAREILAAKGIAFPEGAAASWQREAGQLTMTNSAANQKKLGGLLETDFGGSLGSPNYWLQLATGARFGLAVDKFERDVILGHHPVYGRCTVPISEVSVIRNSPPEPTEAIKSLDNWRLVFAPEPVLPEAGGESSALLGKEAVNFKLPLLEGGDFELSQEKGHVVVVDFWATWCGPCIQSLPGLIEAMAAFPADRVKLIGVNQSEPAEQVKRFLQTRGWKLAVALDAGQSVGQKYGVDGIPHTVVIGPDGKVAWVKTGYSPDGETEVAEAVKKALGTAAPAPKVASGL